MYKTVQYVLREGRSCRAAGEAGSCSPCVTEPQLLQKNFSQLAEWSRRTYPAPLGAGGVGSIPTNSDAQNVPSFRRWRFVMKLSPFFSQLHFKARERHGMCFVGNVWFELRALRIPGPALCQLPGGSDMGAHGSHPTRAGLTRRGRRSPGAAVSVAHGRQRRSLGNAPATIQRPDGARAAVVTRNSRLGDQPG
jgi:hypothetical protein